MINQSDGSINFKETWVVRFDGGPFTYAFRCIPQDRVDRIGSPFARILLYNVFPEAELESLLGLVQRLSTRIAQFVDNAERRGR